MSEYIATLVAFVSHHAGWTFPVMFVAAFGESFVFISLLFPGTAIMIAAGLLIPGGTLDPLPLLAGSILGAVLGDGVSWHLGRRYGHLLENRWPFTRRPGLLRQGEAFFHRFGLASVFLGRFFGPMRATIPLIAGIAKMRPLPFWLSNVVSALIWAPALLFSGSAIIMLTERLSVSYPIKIVVGAFVVVGLALFARLAHRRWYGKGEPG
jgi:membrane protein DedA with SNARE-associated domain